MCATTCITQNLFEYRNTNYVIASNVMIELLNHHRGNFNCCLIRKALLATLSAGEILKLGQLNLFDFLAVTLF